MFSSNSGNQQEIERTVRQMENARFSVDTITEDVMHAGFFSDFDPSRAAVAYNSPAQGPCADAAGEFGWNVAAAPMQVPLPVEGILAANTAFDGCLQRRRGGTEALVIRRAETGPPVPLATASASTARRSNLYIQTSRCEGDPGGLIQVGFVPSTSPEATFGLRRPIYNADGSVDCTATRNDELRRVVQRTYFVSDCNDCAGAGDGIPTLKRVEFIDGALRTTAIAEGIENVQFEFGVDSDGDGAPDGQAVRAGGVVAAGGWQNVVAVRMHVLARSTQPTAGFTDLRTYQLGAGVETTPADGFKRTLLSATARLHNVGGRRERE